MEAVPQGCFIKYKPNAIDEVRKLHNLDEKRIVESVDLLCDWMKKQEHFRKKDLSREYLEKCLIRSKGSVELAKRRLDKLFTCRTLWPELFQILDVYYFRKYDDIFISAMIPEQTDDFVRLNVIKVYPDKPFPSDVIRDYINFANILLNYMYKNDYSSSLMLIMDIRDVNLMDLLSILNTTYLSQLISLFLGAHGLSVKGIHILTTSKLSDMLVSFLKQVLSKKVGDRLHVHRTVDSIYEFVPKKILPSDLGGDSSSLVKLRDSLYEELSTKEHIEYVKEMNKACTDESRRPKEVYNDLYINMPGSFRSLTVD